MSDWEWTSLLVYNLNNLGMIIMINMSLSNKTVALMIISYFLKKPC